MEELLMTPYKLSGQLDWQEYKKVKYRYAIDEIDNGYVVKIWKSFYSLTENFLVPEVSVFSNSFEEAIQVVYNYRARETKSELEKCYLSKTYWRK